MKQLKMGRNFRIKVTRHTKLDSNIPPFSSQSLNYTSKVI
jgi:hypothetical protein